MVGKFRKCHVAALTNEAEISGIKEALGTLETETVFVQNSRRRKKCTYKVESYAIVKGSSC